MTKPGVIFDLDGTLVHTEPVGAAALISQCREWGVELDGDASRILTGRAWPLIWKILGEKYELLAKIPIEKAMPAIARKYREALATEWKAVAGAAEAVAELGANYDLALVSGSNRDEIYYSLDRLGVRGHFKTILGCEDYLQSKPAPDGFSKAIEQLRLDPKRTLVFEDSHPGIVAAKALRLKVAAITSTNHSGQDQSLADWAIADLTGIDARWVRERLTS